MVNMDITQIAVFIKTFAVVLALGTVGYGGLVLMTSKDPEHRSRWKDTLLIVFMGLSMIFLSQMIAQLFSGGTYCA